MGKVSIGSFEEFEQYVGKSMGVSDYLKIEQSKINQFADATLDHQWIHTDAERRGSRELRLPGPKLAAGFTALGIALALMAWIGVARLAPDPPTETVREFDPAGGVLGVVAIGGDGTLSIGHRLAQKGLRVVGMKLMKISNDLAAKHYEAHKTKGFYAGLRWNDDKPGHGPKDKGSKDKDYLRVREQISNELMTIRFTARTVERLSDSVRSLVDEVRRHERGILDISVEKAQMPRQHFIKVFAGTEGSKRWLSIEINSEQPWSEQLRRVEPSILELLGKIRGAPADALVDVLERVNRGPVPAVATGLGRIGSLQRRLTMIKWALIFLAAALTIIGLSVNDSVVADPVQQELQPHTAAEADR